ncbi:MAG: hypothetical protein CBC48_13435 [bacterium TMED88]|nr:hypothetical protein [Deltaproteobacteria bacterium]OUV28373.1 MAG: hypothetical protein CBC48_13435 [bacterium TMED88]
MAEVNPTGSLGSRGHVDATTRSPRAVKPMAGGRLILLESPMLTTTRDSDATGYLLDRVSCPARGLHPMLGNR